MEPMTGAEFAARARAQPYLIRCPIIIATGSREGAAQCVRSGLHEVVDGFILKPFTMSDLSVKLLEIRSRKRARKFTSDSDDATRTTQPTEGAA
jgi:CheY-like chemotaxis protein